MDRSLVELDAEAARLLHPNDQLRLIRAIEIRTLPAVTGAPTQMVSRFQRQPPGFAKPPEKMPMNIDRFGNTSSATIPTPISRCSSSTT